jgi:hypothetical protein
VASAARNDQGQVGEQRVARKEMQYDVGG